MEAVLLFGAFEFELVLLEDRTPISALSFSTPDLLDDASPTVEIRVVAYFYYKLVKSY